MKTLIINGSPRKHGDTAQMIRKLREKLPGEVEEFVCYGSEIGGCVDCRYCWKEDGCCRKDGWQELDRKIRECDSLLIASPVYFFELTGRLLDVFSRVQSYWCARFYRKKELIPKVKRGGILLVGGGNGSMERAAETASLLLKDMRCVEIAPPVCCHNTDRVPAEGNEQMEGELTRLAGFFSGTSADTDGNDTDSL